MKKLLCTLILLSGVTALHADVFAFSYTGTSSLNKGVTVTGTGDLTATYDGSGIYTITGLTGTQNGAQMSLYTPGFNFFYDGKVTSGTFDFLLSGYFFPLDVMVFSGSSYAVTGLAQANSGSTFQLSRVPETATLSLLFTMGLGVWALARKLPTKKQL